MAIPKALADRRAKLEAQQKQNGATAASTQADETTQVGSDDTQDNVFTPASSADIERLAQEARQNTQDLDKVQANLTGNETTEQTNSLAAELAQLRQQQSSMAGRLSAEAKRAAELEQRLNATTLQQQTALLEAANYQAKLEALEAERETAVRAQKLQAFSDVDDITEEELGQFDAQTVKLIKALTKRTTQPIVTAHAVELEALNKKLASYEKLQPDLKQVQAYQKTLADNAAAQSEKALLDRELTPLVSNWAELPKHPKWSEFMSQPIHSGASYTNADILTQNRKNSNVLGIASILDKFQSFAKVEGMGSLATPATKSSEAAVRTTTAVNKIKTSDYMKVRDAAIKNRALNSPEYLKFKTQFDQARTKGLVEDDANILR